MPDLVYCVCLLPRLLNERERHFQRGNPPLLQRLLGLAQLFAVDLLTLFEGGQQGAVRF